MKKEILLSIVCPVYNGEKIIGKFIESLEKQKHKNEYELILVNDGSSDSTLKILKEYEKKYNNIIAIDKKHSGVSDTRNIGIAKAKGKYITFGDCDDWYSSHFLDKIIPILQNENFELFYFNAYIIDNGKQLGSIIPRQYQSSSFFEDRGIQKYLQGEFLHKLGSIPWNKIYRKSIIEINKLKFNKNKKSGEDLLFNLSYVSKIKNYLYLDEKLYYYVSNSNSNYRLINLEEIQKYYKPMEEICLKNHINNWEHFIGLFFLRKFLGVLLNEIKHPNYQAGKINLQKYLKAKEIEQVLRKIKFKNLDSKLFIAYLLYKFKFYKPTFFLVWHLKKQKIKH